MTEEMIKEIKNIQQRLVNKEMEGEDWEEKMEMIRKLGRFVEFSVFGAPVTLDWSVIGDGKELDVLGSHLSPYAFPFVIEHIKDGSLTTEGMVSHIFALEDWEKAFEYATGKYGDFKVAFQF